MKDAITPMLSTGREEPGIIVGITGEGVAVAYSIYKTKNIMDSSVVFESDPWEVVQAHKMAEVYGIRVIGVFHTHPLCPPKPSGLDVEGMKRWPLVWVIACRGREGVDVAAWKLEDSSEVREVLVE